MVATGDNSCVLLQKGPVVGKESRERFGFLWQK